MDARFFAQSGSPPPDFAYLSSLSGPVLRADSVEAGTHWTRCRIPTFTSDGSTSTGCAAFRDIEISHCDRESRTAPSLDYRRIN